MSRLRTFNDVTNNQLASDINNTTLSITLKTGQGSNYPTLDAGEVFVLTLSPVSESEITDTTTVEEIVVTAVIGDVLTVQAGTRGLGETTAQSWLANTYCLNLVSAGALIVIQDAMDDYRVPVGGIMEWGGAIANIPTNWRFCNGAVLTVASYPVLFAALGYIHGGNGTTTFALPDKRDLFDIGAYQDDSGVPKTNITGSLTASGGDKDAVLIDHKHGIYERYTDPDEPGLQHDSSSEPDRGVKSTLTDTSGGAVDNDGNPIGESGTNKNLPPYRAAVYMIRVY